MVSKRQRYGSIHLQRSRRRRRSNYFARTFAVRHSEIFFHLQRPDRNEISIFIPLSSPTLNPPTPHRCLPVCQYQSLRFFLSLRVFLKDPTSFLTLVWFAMLVDPSPSSSRDQRPTATNNRLHRMLRYQIATVKAPPLAPPISTGTFGNNNDLNTGNPTSTFTSFVASLHPLADADADVEMSDSTMG